MSSCRCSTRPSVAARPSAHRGERPSSRERPLAAYRKACYKEGARRGRSSAPLTGCEASSNQGIHAKMSPTTMTFGRDKSLRPFEKSQGFFQMGEGSWQSFEGLLPSPKNRTKYQYDANGNLVETIDANANANGGTGNVIVYALQCLESANGRVLVSTIMTAARTDSNRTSADTLSFTDTMRTASFPQRRTTDGSPNRAGFRLPVHLRQPRPAVEC